jgi:HK97 family phage portal protein
MGISAVLRAVSLISSTIAALPLRTYERDGEDRVRIPSVFDDPYPGLDGMTPFAWSETILMHLLLWREAFLWHDQMDRQGNVTVYRPILPSAFHIVRKNGARRFFFNDPITGEEQEVGSDQVTYIPGPSLDAHRGHPLLYGARAIFSGAISGDKAAAQMLRRGIRLAGLVTPGEGEDIDPTEGEAIVEQLRMSTTGHENAGDIAFVNRRLKLDPWMATNVEAQWHETRQDVNQAVGQIFGVPPHLLNDTEKQTSWGTGVAEQNLSLARYTLMGWSTRIEEVLSMRLPAAQFCEYDYKGLLQGTPTEEAALLIQYREAGIMDVDEVRKVINLPPLTPAQRAAVLPPAPPVIPPPPKALPKRPEIVA